MCFYGELRKRKSHNDDIQKYSLTNPLVPVYIQSGQGLLIPQNLNEASLSE